MSQGQVACVAVEALPFYEKEAKERQVIRKGNQAGATSSPLLDELKGRADAFAAKDFKAMPAAAGWLFENGLKNKPPKWR